jgi:hypothetical protein
VGPSEVGEGLRLGDRVSLAEARGRAGFEVLVPPIDELGPPDAVHYSDAVAGGQVSLVYDPTDALPVSPQSGVGLLITEFPAQLTEEAIEKNVRSGTRLQEVTVGGDRGFWFEGEPHELFFLDRGGQLIFDNSRLAGNTLLWEHDGLILRLEGQLSQAAMIDLAESLSPTGR